MKYLITETQKEKIYNLIYDYIDNMMPDNPYVEFVRVVSDCEEDLDTELYEDSTQVVVYDNDELDEMLFQILLPEFWKSDCYQVNPETRLVNAPILVMSSRLGVLETLFNDMWKKPFEDWIQHNIPELGDINIKTYEIINN